jgi:hypothetical protein
MSLHPNPIQRWHRRPRSRKQGPKPIPCSSPLCPRGWEALPDKPYCLACDALINDRADIHRERAWGRNP